MFRPVKFLKKVVSEIVNLEYEKKTSLTQQLYNESISSSKEYAKKNMAQSMMFFNTADIWTYAINKINSSTVKGACLEFGVFKGTSINFFASRIPNQHFFGFDSFEGLQEDWQGWTLLKGAFDLKGELPVVEKNVTLIKGWYDSTLEPFKKQHIQNNIKFIHIDCDTYEATKTVFQILQSNISAGTLILFDEYFGYRNWENGEFKALQEFISANKLHYTYLAFSNRQVLLQIL